MFWGREVDIAVEEFTSLVRSGRSTAFRSLGSFDLVLLSLDTCFTSGSERTLRGTGSFSYRFLRDLDILDTVFLSHGRSSRVLAVLHNDSLRSR